MPSNSMESWGKWAKPIETYYRGYRFRSRSEARWAVLFTRLGVAWEYEKEGFDLGALGPYLPDFWLRDFGWWEVKGSNPSEQECLKVATLSEQTHLPGFISWGRVAALSGDTLDDEDLLENRTGAAVHIPLAWLSEFVGCEHPCVNGWISMIEWVQCRICGHIYPDSPILSASFRTNIGECGHGHQVASDGRYSGISTDTVKAAYRAAQSARFEHGERG